MTVKRGRGRPQGTQSSFSNRDPEGFWYLGQEIALRVGIATGLIPVSAHPAGPKLRICTVAQIIRDIAADAHVSETTAKRAYREFADCNQPIPLAAKPSRIWLPPDLPVRKSRIRRTSK